MDGEPGAGDGQLRAALVQDAPVPGDLAANAELIRATLRDLEEIDLAIFPELFLSGYRTESIAELALTPEHELLDGIRQVAAEHGTALIFGAPERTLEGVANAAFCIDADGELVAIQRKGHLFGAENGAFRPGDAMDPVPIGPWAAGLLICFDLEFPEAARTLALRGADLLVTIAANMEPFGADHDVLARARALENGVPHLYVNRTGAESGHEFVGGSIAVDADANVLAEAGSEPDRLIVTVPLRGRRDPRTSHLRMRRPELYGLDPASPTKAGVDPAVASHRA